MRSAMTSYGNEFLCCREEAGGPYYAYRLWTGSTSSGRFYTKEEEDGAVRFRFDRERFGFGPAAGEDATSLYVAEFHDCSWDCGLDEEQVIANFHLIKSAWSAGG